MTEGTLIYNELEDRPSIQQDNGCLQDLHCGDCFQYADAAEPVRLEYNHAAGEWYLMNQEKPEPIRYNHRVKI